MALMKMPTNAVGGGSSTIEYIPLGTSQTVALQKNDIVVQNYYSSPNLPTAGTYDIVKNDTQLAIFYITADTSSYTASSSYNAGVFRLGDIELTT